MISMYDIRYVLGCSCLSEQQGELKMSNLKTTKQKYPLHAKNNHKESVFRI